MKIATTEDLMELKTAYDILEVFYKMRHSFLVKYGHPASHIFIDGQIERRLSAELYRFSTKDREPEIMGLKLIISQDSNMNFVALL